MNLYKLVRPAVFKLNPETDHHLVGSALTITHRIPFLNEIVKLFFKTKSNPVEISGIKFDNPIGMAAGFDKSAAFYNGLAGLGAGFVEVGSLTLRPQDGNPGPRVTRLVEDEAIINHMGLNNCGIVKAQENLEKVKPQTKIGVSIAPNHDLTTEQMVIDMAKCVAIINKYCDYLAMNLSCPNQDGVLSLQEPETIIELLNTMKTDKPVFLKFSSDLSNEKLFAALDAVKDRIAGVVMSNTSLKRENLKSKNQDFIGGLSGKPLFEPVLEQTKMIKEKYPDLAIMFSGGVFTPSDAKKALDAGADLVQVYTGMIFEGPTIFKDINKIL